MEGGHDGDNVGSEATAVRSTDDLDEGDVLFSAGEGADRLSDRPSSSSHPSLTTSPTRQQHHDAEHTATSASPGGGRAEDGSSPSSLHSDHRQGLAIPRVSGQGGSHRWENEDDEDEDEDGRNERTTTSGMSEALPFGPGGTPSSLRPDMRQRVNLNCRRSKSSQMALSFSLSFKNHAGVRRKVGSTLGLAQSINPPIVRKDVPGFPCFLHLPMPLWDCCL